MKKSKDINGTFHTVALVRDPVSNITSYSVISIELKNGQVVETRVTQSDVPAIVFNRLDAIMRANAQTPIEEIVNAKA